MIETIATMFGVAGVAAASIRKDVGVRLDFGTIRAQLDNDPTVAAAVSKVAAARKKVTKYHDRVRRCLDPRDPASSKDQLTTRLPSDLEDPHRAAQQRLADARRATFRRRLPQFEAQLEADKLRVDAAYAELSAAMGRLDATERGVNGLAPFGDHIVVCADEQHREGREHRGWRARAFPKKPVHEREEISLLEGLG